MIIYYHLIVLVKIIPAKLFKVIFQNGKKILSSLHIYAFFMLY